MLTFKIIIIIIIIMLSDFLYFQKLSSIAERRVFNHLRQEDNTISPPIIFI